LEHKEKQIPEKDLIPPKSPSSDFWSSRGNIGEKINLLVGLNLMIINLISIVIQTFKTENTVPENVTSDLTMIKNFLSTLLTNPNSNQEILESLGITTSKVSSMLAEFSDISKHPDKHEKPELEKKDFSIIGFFKRTTSFQDKWGIIDSIDNILSSYSNLSHLGFPTFYLAVCRELHQYEVFDKSFSSNLYDIVQIPSTKLKTIISKLLREAPSARLLQNLRRMFPEEHDIDSFSLGLEQINTIVTRYYQSISDFLSGIQGLEDSIRSSTIILREFNLGEGDLESRIPNVSFSVLKETYREMEAAVGNDIKQYILSETVILIHHLNNTILENDRFVLFLRRLK
jgi:hypothetical protein